MFAISQWGLGRKLIAAFMVVGLVPLTVGSGLAYSRASSGLLGESRQQLVVQARSMSEQIDRNLFERLGDVQVFAFNPMAAAPATDVTTAANFYTKAYGFYDLMMVADANGTIIATNTVNSDSTPFASSSLVGTSVKGQPWFEKAMSSGLAAGQTDVEQPSQDAALNSIKPGNGSTVRFTAPVRDGNGKAIRVWSNLASLDRIGGQILNEQVHAEQERGNTGFHAQLVSNDGTLLEATDSNDKIGTNLSKSSKSVAALATEKEGSAVDGSHVDGYVRSAGALGFGVVAAQKSSQALHSATVLRDFMVALWIICAVLIGVAAHFISRSIVGPVRRASLVTNETAQILSKTSLGLAHSSSETTELAEDVARAASAVGAEVASVAAAMEEMHATIAEIAGATSHATAVVNEASATVYETSATVGELGDSSSEIGKVVVVITSIAEQTNLLALNATIEAARAGEAGKGFAVVANEVKELAKETSRATSDIEERVAAIQSNTTNAVEAMERIAIVINKITEVQSTIASAIEEQTATTAEVSRSIADVTKGADGISTNITVVAGSAQTTSQEALEIEERAADMRTLGDDLYRIVSGGSTKSSGASTGAALAATSSTEHVIQPRRFGLKGDRHEEGQSSDYQDMHQ